MAKIELIECTSTREFLDALDPTLDRWWSEGNTQTHFFRGHADATWDLVPSGMRPFAQVKELEPFYRKARENLYSQEPDLAVVRLEMRLTAISNAFSQFKEMADRIGIEVGDNDFHLGQHHGIPTQYLDWSFSPYVAAFFSLGGPRNIDATHLSVWALYGNSVHFPSGDALHIAKRTAGRNSFMLAQRGVLSELVINRVPIVHDEDYPIPSLQALHDLVEKPFLTKVTLPRTEEPALRRHLERLGIVESLLTPSLQNVGRDVMTLGPKY